MTTNEIVREKILASTNLIRKNVEALDKIIEVLPNAERDKLTAYINKIYTENDAIGLSASVIEK